MQRVELRLTGALVLLLAGAVTSSGCYHSIVDTGLPVGTEMHREAFEPAFIVGLVPAEVDAAGYCQGRPWARVETQQSFLNWVVAAVTFGIFTPLDIRVYCAGSGAPEQVPAEAAMVEVGAEASAAERERALQWAMTFAREKGEPVYLAF